MWTSNRACTARISSAEIYKNDMPCRVSEHILSNISCQPLTRSVIIETLINREKKCSYEYTEKTFTCFKSLRIQYTE